MTIKKLLTICSLALAISTFGRAADKPKISLDEFFNYVGFDSVKIAPDGRAVVITTDRADWDQKIFRTDLWLYRVEDHGGTLIQLTQSGHDRSPEWSPSGRWIAFISDRKASGAKKDDDDDDAKGDETAQLYLISSSGGEAFAVTEGEEEVQTFAWSPDSRTLYYATRQPWTKDQKDAYKKEWKDVKQYRAAERGDTVFSLGVDEAISRHAAEPAKDSEDSEKEPDITSGSRALATTPWHIQDIDISPDGRHLAFVTESVSERQEKMSELEIYSVDLSNASPAIAPHQVTHNEAVEQHIRWAPDNKHIFFEVELGSVEGKYKDVQQRVYWVDATSGEPQRWAADFKGAVLHYSPTTAGGVIALGRLGTEVHLYSQASPTAPFTEQAGWPGTYEQSDCAGHSSQIAFVYSSLQKPAEVYVADGLDKLSSARPITSFNHLFTERDLPQGKPYRWTAEDGTSVEGMLMYPPAKFEAKNLPMFVFIHGGPADADGNHFEADWYQWDRLAANQGWLVFEPNYRGSVGYGDAFAEQIVPQIVSRPGKDILEGVDALVKDGIADPNQLAIGGYSYGGYMTNWLITQTTRFKAAVTGAGAVEHVANWGNDDTTFDDAYFLGGEPWVAAQRYHDEAAIFQINKVHTPTHMVAGAEDIRVAVAEDYLLDHALHNLGVPSTLLIFPGEGHSLDKNPWHGKIKVREELKWLAKYGGVGTR
jgi:dipeptidyl aminopeptidase/acylaminoacyl peptidase